MIISKFLSLPERQLVKKAWNEFNAKHIKIHPSTSAFPRKHKGNVPEEYLPPAKHLCWALFLRLNKAPHWYTGKGRNHLTSNKQTHDNELLSQGNWKAYCRWCFHYGPIRPHASLHSSSTFRFAPLLVELQHKGWRIYKETIGTGFVQEFYLIKDP